VRVLNAKGFWRKCQTGNEAISYVLILTIITSFGGVDTQRVPGVDSYQSCAEHAVAWADSQRPLYPEAHLRWQCQRGDE